MAGLGPRFDRALQFASELHAGDKRKGSDIPYIGHLLGVASIVIDDGGSEDEAIAALLHDAAEDRGGEQALARIEAEFGAGVRHLVRELSDTLEHPKPAWRERKQAHIAALPDASNEALRVSLADKLYNARAIVIDHRRVGDHVWERFNAGKEDSLWYYRALADVFEVECPGALSEEYSATVGELERLGS